MAAIVSVADWSRPRDKGAVCDPRVPRLVVLKLADRVTRVVDDEAQHIFGGVLREARRNETRHQGGSRLSRLADDRTDQSMRERRSPKRRPHALRQDLADRGACSRIVADDCLEMGLTQHQHTGLTRRGRRRRAWLVKEKRDLAHTVATIQARDDFAVSPDRELALRDNQELLRGISYLPDGLTLSISTGQAPRRQPREFFLAEVGEERNFTKEGDDVVRVVGHVRTAADRASSSRAGARRAARSPTSGTLSRHATIPTSNDSSRLITVRLSPMPS